MPPPASMRAHAGSPSKSGNRSPPRQLSKSVATSPNQAPGAMRGWEPNSEMAATRQSRPPAAMSSPGQSGKDMPRTLPAVPYSDRKVPRGYTDNT
jgi:hypothetical protein